MLADVCTFLDLPAPDGWLGRAERMMGSERRHHSEPIRLPPKMAEAFNALQQRYGFPGRAEP